MRLSKILAALAVFFIVACAVAAFAAIWTTGTVAYNFRDTAAGCFLTSCICALAIIFALGAE